MSDTRTYIVPDGQENSTNQMLPWMAMMNGGMGGFGNGMWNNPFMYLVWMWMMRWYATMVANGMMVDWEDVL